MTPQVAEMLPSKTIPEVNNGKNLKQTCKSRPKAAMATAPPKKKVRACSVEVEEIDDEDSTHNIATRNSGISPTSSFEIPNTKMVCYILHYGCFLFHWRSQKGRNMKKSPIYLFYEVVTNGPNGTPGDDGDVHYHCLHGAHKVCTIKRSMRSNLNGALSLILIITHIP